MRKLFIIGLLTVLFLVDTIYTVNAKNVSQKGHLVGSQEVFSGSVSTGSVSKKAEAPIDYSTYLYYDGTFDYKGVTYGNSLYSKNKKFPGSDLSKVNIILYNSYQLPQKTQTTQSLKLQSTAGTQKSAVSTNGLVGSWDLDGNAIDSSGNGNNGTSSHMSWDTSSGANQVGSFNGNNSKVTIPDDSILDFGTGDFSVSAWVKATVQGKYIFSKKNNFHQHQTDGMYGLMGR